MSSSSPTDRPSPSDGAAATGSSDAPFIRARGLEKRYTFTASNTVTALNGVDLDVAAGERLVILGKSGSGKSTMMNLLGGLDRPTAGTIEIDGRDIGAMGAHELAVFRSETVGFVFQAFHLQPRFRAWENVAMPLIFAGVNRHERRDRAFALLEQVGLASRANHKPTELSGGEQQRVALARALVSQPRLLLGDEPTGNLDSNTSAAILNVLEQVNAAGTTLVIVTHDDDLADDFGTRTIHMADGRILKPGERRPRKTGKLPMMPSAAAEGGAS